MYKKKPVNMQSPDLSNLQAVSVNQRTTIFIPVGADPIEAKKRCLFQMSSKYVRK